PGDFIPTAGTQTDFEKVATFEVGDRQWAMVLRPTMRYLRQHETHRARWLLLIELLVTAFIAACFAMGASLLRRRSELQHLNSLKTTQEALRVSEERYAIALKGANDGLWDWDPASGVLYVSGRWKEMLGLPESLEVSMTLWSSLIRPADRPRVEQDFHLHLAGSTEYFESEYRIMHSDGAYRWVLSRGLAVRGADRSPSRVAGSLTDITATKAFDPLTRLPNRLCFADKLESIVERFRRDHSRQFAVIFIDLDRFKVINDSLGHVFGDELLQAIGQRISGVTVPPGRSGFARATAARLGGDEFAVLLEDLSRRADGMEFAQRITAVFDEPFLVSGREMHCAASIGIAFSDEEHRDPADILRDADTAMYHAKNRGRARLEVFDSLMRASAQSRMELEMAMREGLDRGEFGVLFQPRVLLNSGAITGFEALARWRHPVRGTIAPMEFVAIAEETGLIVPIGRVVLREACRRLRSWKDRYPFFATLRVSVNVSAKQLQDAELFTCIAEVLAETGLESRDLCLEITETVLMEQSDGLSALLTEIRRLGVGIEIDDFGTGFCSLNYLHQFTFDAIKIDRTFVAALSEGKTEIVRTVVSLGESLGMPVIAEGIETPEQRMRLEAMDCRYGQGYLFAPPIEAAAVEELLASNASLGSTPAGLPLAGPKPAMTTPPPERDETTLPVLR
ncbi:MAG: EAL domain-containing protein, partial [Acidobacteriota bacterium]|nr:EAL domain-containing protein [Acidobacteriota bacterium]